MAEKQYQLDAGVFVCETDEIEYQGDVGVFINETSEEEAAGGYPIMYYVRQAVGQGA